MPAPSLLDFYDGLGPDCTTTTYFCSTCGVDVEIFCDQHPDDRYVEPCECRRSGVSRRLR